MGLLYEDIMNVPGLSGNWQDRLNNFGQRFYGNDYSGSYDQNMNLYGNIQKGNYGAPQAPAQQAAPAAFVPPAPNKITPFRQVMPQESIFPQGTINQLAESQVAPDINRQQNREMATMNRGQAASGAYRSGSGAQAIQDLQNSYSRQLKEQTANFAGNINDWVSNWYNQQSTNYYENPSAYVAPTLPTFQDYMKDSSFASAYNNYLPK